MLGFYFFEIFIPALINELVPCILWVLILILKIIEIIAHKIFVALLVISEIWLALINKIYWNDIWIVKGYISEIACIITSHFIISWIDCSFVSISKSIISNIWEISADLLGRTWTPIGTHNFFHHYEILVAISQSSSNLLNTCILNRLPFNLVIACNISPCLNIRR